MKKHIICSNAEIKVSEFMHQRCENENANDLVRSLAALVCPFPTHHRLRSGAHVADVPCCP